MHRLLIVDDETSICTSLTFALEDNYNVFTANDEESALKIISNNNISVVLLDLKLGKSDGMAILRRIKKQKPDIVVIIMTAYGTIESSVEAIKSGAFYYITKPINTNELLVLLARADEYISLNSKIKYLKHQIDPANSKYSIIGSSKKMAHIFELIDRVKDIDINVLITGESGTGKELVAKAIHFEGKRKDKPFNAINCAAIPDTLLESELFGFKKGSFTGAAEDKKGIIEMSDGGTLFLDEIGDMSVSLQAKLLRVIQDREVRPIGATKSVGVNVRIISATNKDIREQIKFGTFRSDLYYRLNVINIDMPPLRERKGDISKLVDYFIKKYNALLDKDIKGITTSALEALEKYKFEGNVRELQNIIERAVVLTRNNFIAKEDLSEEIFHNENIINAQDDIIPAYIGDSMKTIEKNAIEYTLKKFEGNRKKTAQILGISERALRYKIKEYM